MATNRRVLLKSRPQGEPTPDNFDVVEAPIPEPKDGEYLSRTIWLSLDPYMRGRMSEARGYASNVNLGDPMGGGTVGQVTKSRNARFKEGDFVVEMSGWQSHAVSDGAMSMKLDPSQAPISTALSVLGMPGMTAWWGLTTIGKPRSGETVVVSAASGAVGSVVGQLARLHGCRAVGIAGGKDKCDYVVNELGFDACVDYRAAGANLFKELQAATPKGIDVYFENVGGPVQMAVIPLLNDFARVPLCGLIASYNEMQMLPGPDWRALLIKRVTVTGFIVSDHFHAMEGFWKEVPAAVKAGRIKYREDVVRGLENAPQAFIGLLKGRNFGKLLVQVSDEFDTGMTSTGGGHRMALYELRTYTLYVGKMAEAVKLYQQFGFPALHKGGHDKHLVGYFQGDTGTINQLVHLWKFEDDADRRAHWAAVFANTDFTEGFAAKFRPLVMTQEVKLLHAAPWGPHP